jgi:hypothetical protein
MKCGLACGKLFRFVVLKIGLSVASYYLGIHAASLKGDIRFNLYAVHCLALLGARSVPGRQSCNRIC